ncbi:hypothetical protein [Patulibacter sp. SYSU D01012]|uniref:hypothetical protein n=1 Tax=Patulibacter sp. SYSU D01012 TaxID=2817381 RepID=UPI001B3043B1|nr:hypothetical protein [Patulibacter sp. SYSU D01012]
MSRPRLALVGALLALAAGAPSAAAQGVTATVPAATVPGSAATAPGATTTGTTATTPQLTAEQAGRGLLLDAGDRVELAQSLADATSETGVCFGYELRLSGSGTAGGTESLSSGGPNVAVDEMPPSSCPRGRLRLDVSLRYTSSSSESEDSASYYVTASGLDGARPAGSTAALKDLTGVDDGALLGDDDDLALRNLAAALPLLLDDADPAEEATTAAAAPNGDRLTGSPGGDWMRAHGVTVLVSGVVLVLALLVAWGGWRARRHYGDPSSPRPKTPKTEPTEPR